jgi:hypothetical protein
MFESIGRSLALVKTSWEILMDDKKLLAFPVLSGIVTILVVLTFIFPIIVTGGSAVSGNIASLVVLFLFYVVSYFVVIFFNTALIACVNARLQGKSMTVGEALANSARHLPAIIGWAIISATIGLILHLLEERAGFIGDIILALIGGVWSLVTYFVVPVLILEDTGVFGSIKESLALIRKTWGESIVGSASMAIIFVVIGVLAGLCVLGTMMLGNSAVFLAALALFLLLVVVLAVIYSAMQGIFVTALYMYAKTGMIPSAFNPDLIQNAFVPKGAGPGNLSGGNI